MHSAEQDLRRPPLRKRSKEVREPQQTAKHTHSALASSSSTGVWVFRGSTPEKGTVSRDPTPCFARARGLHTAPRQTPRCCSYSITRGPVPVGGPGTVGLCFIYDCLSLFFFCLPIHLMSSFAPPWLFFFVVIILLFCFFGRCSHASPASGANFVYGVVTPQRGADRHRQEREKVGRTQCITER